MIIIKVKSQSMISSIINSDKDRNWSFILLTCYPVTDGAGGVEPFPIYCNLEDRSKGIALSIVSHDSLGDNVVGSKAADGYYTRAISYNSASIAQLKALIKTHSYCLQGKWAII